MRKTKQETTEEFKLRRDIKTVITRQRNGFYDNNPEKQAPRFNRVHISNHPQYWRFFKTRTKETTSTGAQYYKYTTKKKYMDIIERAKFLAAHGRYPSDQGLNPVEVVV